MNETTIANSALKVVIDNISGCFSITQEETGTCWASDPFTGSAGEIVLKDKTTSLQVTADLSKSSYISVKNLWQYSRSGIQRVYP